MLLPSWMIGRLSCCSRPGPLESGFSGQEKVGAALASGKPHRLPGFEPELRQRSLPAALDVVRREDGVGSLRGSGESLATQANPQLDPETAGKSAYRDACPAGLAPNLANPVSLPSHLALTLRASDRGGETGKRHPGRGLADINRLPLLMGAATLWIARELAAQELMRQQAVADLLRLETLLIQSEKLLDTLHDSQLGGCDAQSRQGSGGLRIVLRAGRLRRSGIAAVANR